MPKSNYPNGFKDGITIKNVPITLTNPGEVFFVGNADVLLDKNQSVAGVDQPGQGTFQRPFRTIDFAIGQCTADRGDVILVLPGHSEDISAAAGIDVDVDGITLIGLGDGDKQAKVTFSNTASTLEVNADNVTIDGIWFEATVTGVLVGVDIIDGADDYSVINCRFSAETLLTDEFIDSISVTTSDRGRIVGNTIDMDEAGAASGIHLVGICLGGDIVDNTIQGDFSVACIESITVAQEHLIIKDNTLINGVNSGLNTLACISLLTGTTGFIQDNQLYTNVVAASTAAVVADSCFFGGGNTVSTTAETVPLEVEGGINGIVRATVATGKADETDGLGLFTVVGTIDVWGIQQRAEVAASSAVLIGVQVDATDTTLDSVLVTDTNLSTQTSVGDYANSGSAGGAFTVVQVENTTGSPMWSTPVRVPAGIIEQAASGTPGALVSGFTVYWSEVSAGATVVAV